MNKFLDKWLKLILTCFKLFIALFLTTILIIISTSTYTGYKQAVKKIEAKKSMQK